MADVCDVTRAGAPVSLTPEAAYHLEALHRRLLAIIVDAGAVYGVTTGLGAAVHTVLRADD